MNLRSLFAIPISIILIVTLSLAGRLAGQEWSGREGGKAAVEAVEQMRLLLALQSTLRAERLVSNLALGKAHPLPEPVRVRLTGVRRETDSGIQQITEGLRANAKRGANPALSEPYLAAVLVRLESARAEIDELLAVQPAERTFSALKAMMPMMFAVSESLEGPLERASAAVTAADPTLSGLVTVEHLTASLRDRVGLIAAVLLPRFNNAEQPTAADQEQVRVLVGQATYLTQLLSETIPIVGATERVKISLSELMMVDEPDVLQKSIERMNAGARNDRDNNASPLPQLVLGPWGERINGLRTAILDATVERVDIARAQREIQFDIVMAAAGAVMVAVLESVVLLGQRVVRPLAHLGLAITRIAAGDRSVPLTLHSATGEMAEMVTAVETLRQAALVADATALRHRLAARQRLMILREALAIAQTVQELGRALERGVVGLSEGIDATIALITTATTTAPPTLSAAAMAVRFGLAEMRGTADDLEATFAEASSAESEDWPEAEFVSHILAVQAEVDRRDATVRGFIQPSLVALRDAACATGEAPALMLRDLVRDQFERIETTVATVASMLAAATRAAKIMRDLPLEETPMAADGALSGGLFAPVC